jgi:NADH-quinone oxidoreductase subunit J
MVVTSKNPVASAMFLVGDLFLLAGVYALLDAHFIAAIQVLVYAGAIVVLFLFVIMLLNLNPNENIKLSISAPDLFMLLVTFIGFTVIAGLVSSGQVPVEFTPPATAGGNTHSAGLVLFTKYLWPFELASMLILLAVVASVVIAKKDKPAVAARSTHDNP